MREMVAHRFSPAFVALLALVIGLLVYLLDRPAGSAYLLPAAGTYSMASSKIFGAVGNVLPSFVHTFAFGLLTALALGRSRRALVLGCGTWWTIGTLFEIGQHPALSGRLAASLPHWFGDWPLLDHMGTYFLRGTFDPADLASTAMGALMAVIFYNFFLSRENRQ